MKTLAIINQKGGVGKTTTAAIIAAALQRKGFKVLAIDLDPQCNLSLITGAKGQLTALELMDGAARAEDAILKTNTSDVIPGSQTLATADMRYCELGKEHRLKNALQQLNYDYCIVDTPPSLGVLTANALTAADYAVIPATASILSLQGITQLKGTIDAVKKYSNADLQITGILLTMFKGRQTLDNEMLELMQKTAKALDTRVFTSTIREAAAIGKSQVNQLTIYDYDAKAGVTQDYAAFINELLEVMK